MDKILEKYPSFLLKYRTTGKVQFLYSSIFLLLLTKFRFSEEGWPLGSHSMKCRDFQGIS